ncbi:SKI/DACH domain-containing protein 1-like isoform X2 [Podarcis raffonei]|uniref:SKI/DACH domain-containing protein 1-like isoform X2 n=1 Tax=Podarcis raffonei TaxID=65483 RepID=UPI0023292FA0|nr:SKI/DACH domain-containing protein 1-like isoform X2 [Podarcis raffonei]
MAFSPGNLEASRPDLDQKTPLNMERRSKLDVDHIIKEHESFSESEKGSERVRAMKMESMLKKVLAENQQLKSAVHFLKQQNKEKDCNAEDCKRAKEKLMTEIGSLLTEIAFLNEVREQLRYKDPESRKETTKALTETIQAKLEVAHAKIEAAEAKKETLEAKRKAEEAQETAEAAQAREDNLLSYVSKIATLAYQQAAEAEYDCTQARKAMAVAEAIQVATLAEGKGRRNHKHHHHHQGKHHRGHHDHRGHHSHHSHHDHRSHHETQSDLPHSEPETLSSTR